MAQDVAHNSNGPLRCLWIINLNYLLKDKGTKENIFTLTFPSGYICKPKSNHDPLENIATVIKVNKIIK